MTTTTENRPESAAECRVERTGRGRVYRPNADIFESADELIVQADMPGTNASDIDIRFERGTLDIRAHVAPRKIENASALLREYGVGDYHRSFQVSEEIDASQIAAEYRDGVLTIRMKKRPSSVPKKIKVEVKGGSASV